MLRFRLLVALSFLFSSIVFGYSFYCGIFSVVTEKYTHLMRDKSDIQFIILMNLLQFALGFAIAQGYLYVREFRKISPYAFCFALFLITRFFGELICYSLFPYGFDMVCIGICSGLCSFLITALVIDLLTKKLLK